MVFIQGYILCVNGSEGSVDGNKLDKKYQNRFNLRSVFS